MVISKRKLIVSAFVLALLVAGGIIAVLAGGGPDYDEFLTDAHRDVPATNEIAVDKLTAFADGVCRNDLPVMLVWNQTVNANVDLDTIGLDLGVVVRAARQHVC